MDRAPPDDPRRQDRRLHIGDLLACARSAGLKTAKARAIVAEVAAAIRRWPEFATPAGVPGDWTRRVAATHRLMLVP